VGGTEIASIPVLFPIFQEVEMVSVGLELCSTGYRCWQLLGLSYTHTHTHNIMTD